jgi:hypothetical protein
MKTVVALYDHLTDAQRAVQDLVDEGLDRDYISLVAGDREGRYSSGLSRDEDAGDRSAEGAATGVVIGGIGGALLGLGALAIPGIGPVVAAGPLIAGLVGAGVGAAVGGLVGALIDAGLPEEHAGYYAEGVRRGGALVSVEATDAQAPQVIDILDRHDPVDINERVSSWRQSGWTRFDAGREATYQEPVDWRDEEFTSEPLSNQTYSTRSNGGSFAATDNIRPEHRPTLNSGSQITNINGIQGQAVVGPNRGQFDEAWRADAQRPEDAIRHSWKQAKQLAIR